VDSLGLPEYFAMEAYVLRKDGKALAAEHTPTSSLGNADPPAPAPGGAQPGEPGGRLVGRARET